MTLYNFCASVWLFFHCLYYTPVALWIVLFAHCISSNACIPSMDGAYVQLLQFFVKSLAITFHIFWNRKVLQNSIKRRRSVLPQSSFVHGERFPSDALKDPKAEGMQLFSLLRHAWLWRGYVCAEAWCKLILLLVLSTLFDVIQSEFGLSVFFHVALFPLVVFILRVSRKQWVSNLVQIVVAFYWEAQDNWIVVGKIARGFIFRHKKLSTAGYVR